MTRLRNGWLMVLLCLPAVQLQAQEDSALTAPPSYTAAVGPNYRPLDAVRRGVVAMPSKLSRKVSLTRQRILLQQALLEIANQAGLGLSYGEELVRSKTMVSIDVTAMSAADALAAVVQGTHWTVFVNPAAQVTVVKARRVGGITGRVTNVATGDVLTEAEVLLDGTRWRTVTDTTGRYRLTEVDTGTYTLTARRVGYTKQSRRVTVVANQEDTVNVALEPVAAKLDELITTATGEQRRVELGNDITTIRTDSVLEVAPIKDLTDLLETRVPGLTVQHTSGAPGDPSRLRLRGLGSVNLSNDPIVFVDGVRIYAVQAEARSANLATGRAAPSPLDQIDLNTIDKIEVFKGASAATLYGADAANGVIVITTKKGRPGPANWSANIVHGRTTMPGQWPVAYFRWGHSLFNNAPTLCPVTVLTCTQDSLVRYQALNDPDLTIFGTGHNTSFSLGTSGGNQTMQYSITGSYGQETGLFRLPAFEAERFRLAHNKAAEDWMQHPQRYSTWSLASGLTARLGTTANISLSTSVFRSRHQTSSIETQIQPLAVTYLDKVAGLYYRPAGDIGTIQPVTSYVEEFYRLTVASTITSTTGATVSWHPRSWFDVVASGGLNVVSRDDQSLLPRGVTDRSDSIGAFSRGTGLSLVGSASVYTKVRTSLPWQVSLETTVGADMQRSTTGDMMISGTGLALGTTTSNGAASVTGVETRAGVSTFGWFIQPQLRRGNFYLPLGVRFDGGSTLGQAVKLISLPKLAASWVISEEPFFPFRSLFSSLRLRAAYGKAGRQPGAADRLRLFSVSQRWLDGQSSDNIDLQTIGNTQLRPERTTELEGGVDADLFDNRVSMVLTGYRRTTQDALISLPLPPSLTSSLPVPINIGVVRNTGFSAVVSLTPLELPAATWSMQLLVSRNRNTLVELGPGVAPFFSGVGRAKQRVIFGAGTRMAAGYPVGGRWEYPILAYADQNGNGVLERDEIRIGDTLVYMGPVQPEYTSSLSSSLGLFGGAVRVTADFSYETGASQIQVNDQTYDDWVLSRALSDPSAPLSGLAAVLAQRLTGVGFNAGQQTNYGAIQTVSTFAFQSLSVNYRAPRRLAKLLGAQTLGFALQGSNLGLHSNYQGKDPRVSAWLPGEQVFDSGQLPLPRAWQLRVDLSY